jgi:hypothetical protein
MTTEKGGAMPAQPALSEERVKRIEITLDSNGKPQLAKGQLCVEIDRSKDEEVLWVFNGPFRIDFKDVSPFYEDQFNETFRQSGLVRRGVLPSRVRVYEYSIEINGKTLDPQIKVFS